MNYDEIAVLHSQSVGVRVGLAEHMRHILRTALGSVGVPYSVVVNRN